MPTPGERMLKLLEQRKIGEDSAVGFGRLHFYRMDFVTFSLSYNVDDGDGEFVDIDKILAAQQGQGGGSKVLRHLCDLADQCGVKLGLYARAMDDKPWSTVRAIRWYERHGFKAEEPYSTDFEPTEEDPDHDGISMWRPLPETKPAASEAVTA